MNHFVKQMLLAHLVFITTASCAQNIIDWNENYKLQLSDFQSSSTQIGDVNIYSLHSGAGIEFAFAMSNAELMFTKNFNSKVSNTFTRATASLVAPDTLTALDLLDFSRYHFDLSELYARKMRKLLYEEKSAFSNTSFFQPVYNNVQAELTKRYTEAAKETDLGRKKERMKELHNEVLKELQEYPDFCKTCKTGKKKK